MTRGSRVGAWRVSDQRWKFLSAEADVDNKMMSSQAREAPRQSESRPRRRRPWASVPRVSVSARTRTPRTALLPLPHRPSTRARRADRQISSRPHPHRAGNAPASKLLTYGTAAASLLTHYSRAHHRVGLTPRGLFARGELLSRWLTSQFAFTAPGEACFGLYLLHALRDVERVRGTRAHATRLLIAAVVSLGIQTLLCADARLVRWLGLGGSSARSSKTSKRRASRPDLTPSSPRSFFPAFSPRNRRRRRSRWPA